MRLGSVEAGTRTVSAYSPVRCEKWFRDENTRCQFHCTSPSGNAGWSSRRWSDGKQALPTSKQMADSGAERPGRGILLCKSFGKRIAMRLLSPCISGVP